MNPMTPEQNTTNGAKVAIPTKEERDMDQRWLAANIFPAESHLRAVREVVEKYITALEHVEADRDEWKERAVNEHAGKANAEIERDTLRSQLAEMTKANEGLRGERDALKEWRDCVSGAIKQIPEFAAGSWYGDKEGWGFHFEMVNHVRRERDALKSELATAKGSTAANGCRPDNPARGLDEDDGDNRKRGKSEDH